MIPVGVLRPRPTEHQQLHFIDRMTVHHIRPRTGVELIDRVPAMALTARDAGLLAEIGAGQAGLVGAVVAVVFAGEGLHFAVDLRVR